MAQGAPHAQQFEFFGPHGPALLLLALPLTVLGLAYGCNERGCMQLYPKFWVPGFAPGQPIYTHEAMAAVAGWFALVLLLHLILPGQRAQGVALPDGSRLTYKLNGGPILSAAGAQQRTRPRDAGGPLIAWAARAGGTPWRAARRRGRFIAAKPGRAPGLGGGRAVCSSGRPLKVPPSRPPAAPAAFPVFAVTYGSALALSRFGLGVLDLTWLADNFVPLLTASMIFSSLLAVCTYTSSFLPSRPRGGPRLLSAHGASGWPAYDFWMGRELNPRWLRGAVDVKEFCELYPGMIGWAILNLAFAARQADAFGSVNAGMILVNAFELWYVADGLYNEKAILTTMDITTDGFGFMLSFGDLCWVPFTFCTQARRGVGY